MSVVQNLVNKYSRRRFACLFFTLLASMVGAPVFSAIGSGYAFMETFLVFNILGAVLITVFSSESYVGWGLLALALLARGGRSLLGYEPLLATSQGIGALICLLAILVMLRFTMSHGRVDTERIFAGLNVFLLFGIMCGLLYAVFEEAWPGSFSFQGSSLEGSKQNLPAHTIYFSFVTLGTLGYGDITPIGGPARALAVAEAISGQMYLVVVVARLVGLYREKTEGDKGAGRTETAGEETMPPI